MEIVLIVIMSGVVALGILMSLKAVWNLIEFRELFKCKHCGNRINTLEYKCKCDKCNRRFKDIDRTYDHLLTFRVTRIDTNLTSGHYIYKQGLKIFIIELTIDILGTLVVLVALLMEVLG